MSRTCEGVQVGRGDDPRLTYPFHLTRFYPANEILFHILDVRRYFDREQARALARLDGSVFGVEPERSRPFLRGTAQKPRRRHVRRERTHGRELREHAQVRSAGET